MAKSAKKSNKSKSSANPIVHIKTNQGEIELEIFEDKMPITAKNFLDLVKKGYYDDVIFHRVIPDFMIQGGDPDGTGRGGPGYTIEDEFHPELSNVVGTIAMANAGPNTGGSQFFINVADNTFLDDKHPVFGKVVKGLSVVMAISTLDRDYDDRPEQDVLMEKVEVK
jgi:peptidylprolyl isomerase